MQKKNTIDIVTLILFQTVPALLGAGPTAAKWRPSASQSLSAFCEWLGKQGYRLHFDAIKTRQNKVMCERERVKRVKPALASPDAEHGTMSLDAKIAVKGPPWWRCLIFTGRVQACEILRLRQRIRM